MACTLLIAVLIRRLILFVISGHCQLSVAFYRTIQTKAWQELHVYMYLFITTAAYKAWEELPLNSK